MPWQNEHFFILVTNRNSLFSTPMGPICLFETAGASEDKKIPLFACTASTAGGLIFVWSFWALPQSESRMSFLCLSSFPFDLSHTLIADRFS